MTDPTPGPMPTLVGGFLGGDVWPPPPPPLPPLPDLDARTQGLRAFAAFVSALEYRRTMKPGDPPEPFVIPPAAVFVEPPDNVQDLPFPNVVFLPGRGQYVARSALGPAEVDESTYGIAGPNTALVIPWDYTELVTVEVWGSKIAERRAIIAALEVVMGIGDSSNDLRIRLPGDFNLVASFALMERENLDDLETVRGRRRGHLYVQMTVPVVFVGKFLPLAPYLTLYTLDGAVLANQQIQMEPDFKPSDLLTYPVIPPPL